MNQYTAVFGQGNRIVTVSAENEADAKVRITEQLNRPGRFEALARWCADGAQVIVQETQP